MQTRKIAAFLWTSATAVAFGVAPMIWPTIDPSAGYLILAGCVIVMGAAGMLYFWPLGSSEASPVTNDGKKLFDQRVQNFGRVGRDLHVNYVNQAVPPTLDLLSDPERVTQTDGGLVTIFRVKLSRPVSRLILQAQGNSLVSMHIGRPARGGVSAFSKSDVRRWRGENYITEEFSNASGEYEVAIRTSDNNVPKLAHELES